MSGGGAVLMSCVREGSLEPPVPYRPPHYDSTRHGEGRTGRFLRGLRRMFKRRGSGARADHSPDPKSSSTSELLEADRAARRKEGAYSSGLSVSHDSVFTGERSGDESGDERPTTAHGGPHLTFSHRAELVAAVRRRGRGDGSDDDEDLGLPRSPPASPPTDKADKRHHAGISQSSCSDGSLLSVGSSEMDEDSSSGHHHDHSGRSEHSDLYNSSEPPTGVAPLSHSAAKHKMAVRPRRTHGAPRRNKNNHLPTSALPITPELNEEMIRSTTPDVTHFKSTEVVTESFSSSITTKHQIVKETQQLNKELQRVVETPSDTKLKSSSLPPGLALSQLGQAPNKLTIAENNTPRSSIKRSQSSTQGKSLQDELPSSISESKIYHEQKANRYKTEKYADDSCPIEKKTKSDKKEETKTKKEESFFSRLLLRKSGKKSKKEVVEECSESKKKSDKHTSLYKPVDSERTEYNHSNVGPTKPEKPPKSAAQRVIASQAYKRNENKTTQESEYKDIYSAVKVTGVEYNITDLKVAEETDKMLNREMKNRFSRRDEFLEKNEKPKRASSKENVEEVYKRESFNLHGHDRTKRPPVNVQRLVDPYVNKQFISNERIDGVEEEDILRPPRSKNVLTDYSFNSGSMPKNIPYFNPNIVVSASASPPKSVLHHSSEHVKRFNRSSEHVSEYTRERHEKHHRCLKTEDSFNTHTGLRSLGEEYVEARGSIGKSHSFRYASETSSISSQDTQMPSLPAIVGISEPLLQSWEVNYRRNVNHHHNSESFNGRHDFSKRISARNYGVVQTTENHYDSLQSTDSSYLDSLKTETTADERQIFTNSIQISVDPKRNSDISQIEAKIDDIISSPKPIIASILKSSSLDSVNSTPEKHADDRRKTISVEYTSDHCKDIIQSDKPESDTYISITHINREPTPIKSPEPIKANKSDEKLQKSPTEKPKLPEFLQIQLNRVDSKPATNVVLTANVTPKKEFQTEKEQDVERVQICETKVSNPIPSKKESLVSKYVENIIENVDDKSPTIGRKSIVQPTTPQSPSKAFFKRKTASTESQEKNEKSRNNSVSTDGSTERIFDSISMDQKSHSSFGSKSSIQSSDSNEPKTPDRHEEAVIYRKKPVTLAKERSNKKNDDEPELMKVFARRSLKIKDSEAESIAQEIAQAHNAKQEKQELEQANGNKTKLLKNEFNASIKSRDSDKENDESSTKEKLKKESDEKRLVDIAARVSQFGMPHYQRSVSITSVASNTKRESAPITKNEVNKYKKEFSDSTPEKRLRNRTFPDPSNDRDDIKNITKSEAMAYKADTLTKKPWLKKDDDKFKPIDKVEKAISSPVIEEKSEKGAFDNERETNGEADGSPQFKGILQMKAEWERRAKQGMTK